MSEPTGTASWRPLRNWSSCAKRFNPSEYCVTIRDRSITHNIELSTEKTLNSNNGIVISKKLLDGKNAVLNFPLLHGYWTDPSALFSGWVGRTPTFTLPTTTHLKNMRSFCTTLYIQHDSRFCNWYREISVFMAQIGSILGEIGRGLITSTRNMISFSLY